MHSPCLFADILRIATIDLDWHVHPSFLQTILLEFYVLSGKATSSGDNLSVLSVHSFFERQGFLTPRIGGYDDSVNTDIGFTFGPACRGGLFSRLGSLGSRLIKGKMIGNSAKSTIVMKIGIRSSFFITSNLLTRKAGPLMTRWGRKSTLTLTYYAKVKRPVSQDDKVEVNQASLG